MIIGNGFSEKNQRFLQTVARLSNNNTNEKILVTTINELVEMDRREIKNTLEYFQELGYIELKTIGGPLLYGHITITEKGLKKASQA